VDDASRDRRRDPLRRDEEHRSYDAAQVERFWRILVQADRVFEVFRRRFVGKVSPVHLCHRTRAGRRTAGPA
jgi:Family of unknown function (DUF5996)